MLILKVTIDFPLSVTSNAFKEINASLAVSGPVLMSISTFVIYSLFNEMRAEVAFTVLSLFASSRVAIRLLPQAINNVVEVFQTRV